LLVIVGLAVFLLGAAVVLITTRSGNSSASAGSVTVVVAKQNLAAGTPGDQLVAGNLISTKSIKPANVTAGALNSTSQLSGRTLAADVPAGQQITLGVLNTSAVPQAAASSPVGPRALEVPVGKQALAIQVPFVAGGAQLVSPGTLVNIYANVAKGGPADLPCTELAFPSVSVLAASTAQGTGAATGGATVVPAAGPDIVYVLAVDPGQAEALIFLQRNESLYFTVVPKSQPASATSGCAGYRDFVRK
jgi:pilus assembly protein CpaB